MGRSISLLGKEQAKTTNVVAGRLPSPILKQEGRKKLLGRFECRKRKNISVFAALIIYIQGWRLSV